MASRPESDGRKRLLASSEPRLTAYAVMLRQHSSADRCQGGNLGVQSLQFSKAKGTSGPVLFGCAMLVDAAGLAFRGRYESEIRGGSGSRGGEWMAACALPQ